MACKMKKVFIAEPCIKPIEVLCMALLLLILFLGIALD